MKKVILLAALVSLCSFAFADIAITPIDSAITFAPFLILGLIVIAIISGGIVLVHHLYKSARKKEIKKGEDKAEFKKLFKWMAIALVLVLGIILFMSLLTPPGNISPGNYRQGGVDSISTAIKIVGVSGQTTTNVFTFVNGAEISADDISSKTGLDVNSLFFMKGQYAADSTLSFAATGKSVVYTGQTAKKLQAIVNCKQTEQALADSLQALSTTPSFSGYSFEPKATCGDVQPCCAIILIRPKN